jgi:FixJ family two-component response regulator
MKSGAYDYLIKDAEGNYLKILPVTVENAIKHKLAELASKQAEEELQKRLRELELYYNITIGRERRIIELKHQVNELLERLGEKKKYKT